MKWSVLPLVALARLFSGVAPWGTERRSNRDFGRSHFQLRVLGRHPGFPIRRLRPHRRLAADAKSCRPSLPDDLEPHWRRYHPPADFRVDEALYEQAGLHLSFRIPNGVRAQHRRAYLCPLESPAGLEDR
jgi:hypothetical protein